MLPQLLANGIVHACLLALVALGFGLIYSATRVFHFAHGAVYALGAYILYSLMVGASLPVGLALGAGILGGAIVGLVIEGCVYGPLASRDAPPLVLMVSSLGLYIVLVNLLAWVYGNEAKVLLPGSAESVHLGPVLLTKVQLLQPLALGIVAPSLLAALRWTNWGKRVRALRDNPRLLEVMGHDARRIRYSILGLGSAMAAIAGMLSALDTGVDPQVGMEALLGGAVAVIIGGVGVPAGALVGAFALSLLQNLSAYWIPSRWEDCLTFGALIVMMTVRPEGLLGHRRRTEEE